MKLLQRENIVFHVLIIVVSGFIISVLFVLISQTNLPIEEHQFWGIIYTALFCLTVTSYLLIKRIISQQFSILEYRMSVTKKQSRL